MPGREAARRDPARLVDKKEGLGHPAIGYGKRPPRHAIREPFEIGSTTYQGRPHLAELGAQPRYFVRKARNVIRAQAMAGIEFGPVAPAQLIEADLVDSPVG
jgi:hypothetical protein